MGIGSLPANHPVPRSFLPSSHLPAQGPQAPVLHLHPSFKGIPGQPRWRGSPRSRGWGLLLPALPSGPGTACGPRPLDRPENRFSGHLGRLKPPSPWQLWTWAPSSVQPQDLGPKTRPEGLFFRGCPDCKPGSGLPTGCGEQPGNPNRPPSPEHLSPNCG